MAQVITVPLFPFLPFHYSILPGKTRDMIKMFLSWLPRPPSSGRPGEHLFYSGCAPFKNSGMLTDAVGHDLPVAGLSGIAVVMFHTMPFWSTPRPPVVRLPLAELRAVNAPAGKRMTISRLSLPRVFAPCTLAGASVVGATGPPNPIVPTGISCALFLEPLGLPIIALPRGYLRLGYLPDYLSIAH